MFGRVPKNAAPFLGTRPNISESHSEISTRVPFCIAEEEGGRAGSSSGPAPRGAAAVAQSPAAGRHAQPRGTGHLKERRILKWCDGELLCKPLSRATAVEILSSNEPTPVRPTTTAELP